MAPSQRYGTDIGAVASARGIFGLDDIKAAPAVLK
jgi:hypothetical protein